ncbi:hypothetical protein PoB_003281400 [Plakobranchus ocellatus]|uniref:Uncharacterized protein n=1 Tax=Plakobranchus ocellatus TaxID=259542 RepID=A0AAV4AIP2_9GAST|nr:hypothetical protein PoB_003281400 [Plakobranchus ocellatus]
MKAKRGKGRPTRRWENDIEEWLETSTSQAGRLTSDRETFRRRFAIAFHKSSVHTGLVSQPLYLHRYHLPGTKKEGTSSEATPAAPAPHPSPACRDFTVTLVGGLSGYSTLPKGLPQASGGKEAP